jgi:hypothetical protein
VCQDGGLLPTDYLVDVSHVRLEVVSVLVLRHFQLLQKLVDCAVFVLQDPIDVLLHVLHVLSHFLALVQTQDLVPVLVDLGQIQPREAIFAFDFVLQQIVVQSVTSRLSYLHEDGNQLLFAASRFFLDVRFVLKISGPFFIAHPGQAIRQRFLLATHLALSLTTDADEEI